MPASLFHISRRSSVGVNPESMPNKLTPRRINGKTVVDNSDEATNPVAATAPPRFAALSSAAKVVPPTVSTAPAQRSLSNGFFDSSFTSSRLIISDAPMLCKNSLSSFFPVEAPDGTLAIAELPSCSVTSASTVGFPLESSISLPEMSEILIVTTPN